MHKNGDNGDIEVAPPPTIKVLFDPEKQMVALNFKSDQFKTWDFIIAVLDMAKQHAEQMKRVAMMQSMQQQAALAQQEAMVRNSLARH